MRHHLNHNKKVDGPLGIRPTVWFVVFGLVLVCMLLISRHHTEQPAREMAVEEVRDQNSSPPSWPKIRRTARIEFGPEVFDYQVSYGSGEIDLSMVEQMVQDRTTWVDDPAF